MSLVLVMSMMMSMFTACADTSKTSNEGTVEGTMEKALPRDPAEDGVLNLLMVGNSFCYYYVEELYELLMENPIPGIREVNIYNLYYSGCKLTQHYDWWREGAAKYELFKVDATGRHKMSGDMKWKLEDALQMADWDYISLQGTVSGGNYLSDDIGELSRKTATVGGILLDHFHELFPHAQLLWHRTWFSEIGRVTSDGYTYKEEDGPKYDAGMAEVCRYMCEEFDQNKPYDLIMVNSGAAWTKARQLNETKNVLPYGGLCARLGKNSFGDGRDNSGDGYHDGDIGGAQLLNAYVWYMTISGNTDISGSAYVPVYKYNNMEYTLEKGLVDLLKEAAMSVFP